MDVYVYMDGWTDKYIVDRWIDGWMDEGWIMDGSWMDMDG